jgi:hypothetical protein
MGREIEPEPGDYPDPVIGYSCDPVDRVCRLLVVLVCLNAMTLVVTVCAFLH